MSIYPSMFRMVSKFLRIFYCMGISNRIKYYILLLYESLPYSCYFSKFLTSAVESTLSFFLLLYMTIFFPLWHLLISYYRLVSLQGLLLNMVYFLYPDSADCYLNSGVPFVSNCWIRKSIFQTRIKIIYDTGLMMVRSVRGGRWFIFTKFISDLSVTFWLV